MSVWQLKRQIALLAMLAVWPDAPSALVYTGGCVVSEDLEGNFSNGSFTPDGPATATLPFARVSCVGYRMDEDQPRRIDVARFRLWSTAGGGEPFPGAIGAAPPNFDTHGVNMENGSLRSAVNPQGNSPGRSVDELVDQFLAGLPNACQFEDSTHGFQGLCASADAMVPVSGVTVLKRSLEIEVFNASAANYYHAPRGFVATALGGGSVGLSWTNPPTRFDTFRNVLRRGTNPGDPAPTTIAGGTGVALAGNLSTTATAAGLTPAGAYNFAVFHVYSEVLPGDRVSAPTPSNPVTVT